MERHEIGQALFPEARKWWIKVRGLKSGVRRGEEGDGLLIVIPGLKELVSGIRFGECREELLEVGQAVGVQGVDDGHEVGRERRVGTIKIVIGLCEGRRNEEEEGEE